MKKIFTFLAATLFAVGMMADCQDGPYGLQINGSKVVDAPKFGEPDAQGRVQYKASCVELAVGDVIKLINQSCDATWMVDLDPYGSYQNFEGGKAAGQITCKVAGSYDFYIKMKENDDLVYIGPAEDCGGTNPGGGGEGGQTGRKYWYWKGEVDGVAIQNEMDGGIFECGLSHIEVEQQAYIFVIYQVQGSAGVQYMTDGWQGTDKQHVTMMAGGNDKLYVPAGEYTLYLYDNNNGTVELSYVELPGKKLVACTDEEAIETPVIEEKARKVFVDGQLRIIRGDKMYDATGRQL